MKICHIISKDREDFYGEWRITERRVMVGRFLPPRYPGGYFLRWDSIMENMERNLLW